MCFNPHLKADANIIKENKINRKTIKKQKTGMFRLLSCRLAPFSRLTAVVSPWAIAIIFLFPPGSFGPLFVVSKVVRSRSN